MKKQFYFTDTQMSQVSHAINYSRLALFEEDPPIILNDDKKMRQLCGSLAEAARILSKEIAGEKKRRAKYKAMSVR